jgi:hypothetical protein
MRLTRRDRFDGEFLPVGLKISFFDIESDLCAIGDLVCVRADYRENPDIDRVPEEDPGKGPCHNNLHTGADKGKRGMLAG